MKKTAYRLSNQVCLPSYYIEIIIKNPFFVISDFHFVSKCEIKTDDHYFHSFSVSFSLFVAPTIAETNPLCCY